MTQRVLVLTIATLLAVARPPLHAADLRNVLADYSLTSWTQKDGLPSTRIDALAQDSIGYLWLGTEAGMLRFDGVRFVPWESLAAVPNPHVAVRSLCAARDGTVWFGLGEPGGIGWLRGGEVRTFDTDDGFPEGMVTAIIEDSTGVIWAAGRFGLRSYAAGSWTRSDAGLPPVGVLGLFIDTDKSLFAATASGVFRRAIGETSFTRFETFTDPTRSIARDLQGRLWVTDPIVGFRRMHEGREPTHALEKGRGMRLLIDSRGGLWVGTAGQGLWRFKTPSRQVPDQFEKSSTATGLSDDGVLALIEDREGNIWASTLDGLNRLTPHKMTPITNLGLVSAVDGTSDGQIWVGSVDAIVPFADGTIASRRPPIPLRHPPLAAMHADDRGVLWVATGRELLRVAGGRVTTVSLSPVSLNQITDITSDGDGGVWLHDAERGLQRWNRGRLSPAPLPHDLRQTALLASYTDRSGRAWLAFENQRVAVIEPSGNVHVYGPDDGLTAGVYRAIYQDRAGDIWLGGNNGLTRYADRAFQTLLASERFPAASVIAIVDDEEGALWLGQEAGGIFRVRPSEIAQGLADPAYQMKYGAFDKFDGSAGTSRWYGSRAAMRAKDGRLWFVAGRGVTVVDPQVLREEKTTTPTVRIEGALGDGRRLTAQTQASFPPRTSRVEIDYTVLNLTSALKTRFRYRLDGFDSDWIDAGTRQQAFYTNLPPREYAFRVMASAADGTFNEPATVWRFAIQPMFYQTMWFLVTAAVGAALAVGAAWRLHVLRVRKQFALLLGERARLSREIHDTLLQSLFGFALQCDAIANRVAEAAPDLKAQFMRMRLDVEEDIREARQSIWNLRSPKLESDGLVDALRDMGAHVTAPSGIDFQLNVTGEIRRCPPNVEEQLLRIAREALLNVVRHAGARSVRLQLAYSDDDVSLSVVDDGAGFDPAKPLDTDPHYGLTTMRERAETVGGAFHISSVFGQGTVVRTIIPHA